jgi:hypothetical protein
MLLPDAVARFNRFVTNRVTGPFAGRLPWFAVVGHRRPDLLTNLRLAGASLIV